ncbi:targeting protein for Xklp2-like isoform X2 [Chelonus insularis]|uniref:targeting protein for Xklp2-like isoform X2 n=1 Tax=Chelonus insularis TaxID=460826 RepID=UPI00158B160A|nr:targeting protein for Xklp2-like isoform X2 [Chelonus insularis]
MDIETSTPIVMLQNLEQSSRLSEVSGSWKLNSQLQQANNNNNTVKIQIGDSWYSKVDGPCYVDFQNGIPDPRDSFFDGHGSCVSTPIPQQKEHPNQLTPNLDIISSLKRCSISRIDDLSEGDSTLKADCTVREFQNSKNSTLLISPDPQRRLSRQSLTTVKPFSFELREKERRERLEAKQHYINILKEQYEAETSKAKRPKFRSTKKANSIDTSAKVKLLAQFEKIADVEQNNKVLTLANTEFPIANKSNAVEVPDKQKFEVCTKIRPETEIIKNQIPLITGQVNKIVEIFDKKKPPDPVKIHLTNKINDKPASTMKIQPTKPLFADGQNVPVKNTLQVENKKEINDSSNKKLVEPWKQKPFQVSLPKRPACIPRSPKLRTAQRARARQLFDDKLKEKEKQQEEMRKKDAVNKEKREKQEIQKLRKQLVHKVTPVPIANTKRNLTDPIIPIFVKRRKLNSQHNTNSKNKKVVK